MPVNLSIEGVPDHIADRLRERARLNRRSLQDELLAIIETSVLDEWQNTTAPGFAEERQSGFQATPKASQLEEVVEQVRALPEERQQEVAQVLLAYLDETDSDVVLSPEQIEEIERCMSDDEPFASDEEVRLVLERLTT